MQSLLKFKTLDEAIERANNTTYGLAAGILTKSLDNALVFSNAVEAGSVWVNCFLAVTPQAPVRIHYFSFDFLFPRSRISLVFLRCDFLFLKKKTNFSSEDTRNPVLVANVETMVWNCTPKPKPCPSNFQSIIKQY